MSERNTPHVWTRRSFLKRSSAATLGFALAGCEGSPDDTVAAERSQGLWGVPRIGGEEALLPPEKRPDGVLEFFLFGGVCPWDSFYVVPDFNRPEAGGPQAGTMWHTFQNTQVNIPDQFGLCGGDGRPLLGDRFGVAGGADVFLGPWLYPLRERPDIVNRMRMWVMQHDQGAHETGIPFALTGSLQSSPRMAATPSHTERYFQERQTDARRAPWSSVVYPGLSDLSALNGEVASATGLHRGSARPLSLRLGQEGLAEDGLTRTSVAGRTAELDRLVDLYAQRWQQRLVRRDTGERVRAPAVEDFLAARRALERADAIVDTVGEEAFSGAFGEECIDASPADYTAMGLRTGVHMLTHPTDPLKWVTVIDGGLLPATGGAAYDTHFLHVEHSSRNLVHSMKQLVAHINEPGENDPGKIDLDRHTVFITTEFGRTPYPVGDGLNHWAHGYVVCAFGGPFDEDRAGIVGSIAEDGYATTAISPTDLRAAMMQLQGIWPFTGESFAVGDISADTLDEIESATWIREHILGYPLS